MWKGGWIRKSLWPRIAILGLAALTAALADSTVTICGLDRQTGPGINFNAAMAAGGTIHFNCGATRVIFLSKAYTISVYTVLDGPVTLQPSPTILPPAVTLPLAFFLSIAPPSPPLVLNQVTINPNMMIPNIYVGDGGSVTMNHCRITNAANGFMLGQGNLAAASVDFVSIAGTAIKARFATLHQSTFDNTALGPTAAAIDSTGGNVSIDGGSFTGGGRILCTTGLLTIGGSSFRNLTAPAGLPGGAILLSGCQATISNTTFSGNKAASGGAIAAARAPAASTLAVTGSQFLSNTATVSGGAISLPTSLGVAHTLTLNFVEFGSNSAQSGGGIDLGGQVIGVDRLVTIAGSTLNGAAINFHDNSASISGGALTGVNAPVQVTRGLFARNTAAQTGGAVYLMTRNAQVPLFTNSLFVRNTASTGSALSANQAQLLYSTISLNQGAAISGLSGTQLLTFSDSIVSGNSLNCDPALPAVAVVDGGHNLQFPGSGCGTLREADPLLDSMYVPGIGSPAQASGDASACARPEVNHADLLGQYRPRVAICTVGAIEGEIESLVRSLPDPQHRISSGPPDFTIVANPPYQTVGPGGTAVYTITAIPANGFGAVINYSVSGNPAGSQVTISRAHGMTWSLTVSMPGTPTAGGTTSPGTTYLPGTTTTVVNSPGPIGTTTTSIIKLTATSGSILRTATVNLSVSP